MLQDEDPREALARHRGWLRPSINPATLITLACGTQKTQTDAPSHHAGTRYI